MGAACLGNTECAGALLCISAHCAPPGEAGASCASTGECATSLQCIGGICSTLGNAAGSACAEAIQCASTLQCIASVCSTLDNPAGSPCSQDTQCATPLVCVDGSCAAQGNLGAPCTENQDCANQVTCYEQPQEPGTCIGCPIGTVTFPTPVTATGTFTDPAVDANTSVTGSISAQGYVQGGSSLTLNLAGGGATADLSLPTDAGVGTYTGGNEGACGDLTYYYAAADGHVDYYASVGTCAQAGLPQGSWSLTLTSVAPICAEGDQMGYVAHGTLSAQMLGNDDPSSFGTLSLTF